MAKVFNLKALHKVFVAAMDNWKTDEAVKAELERQGLMVELFEVEKNNYNRLYLLAKPDDETELRIRLYAPDKAEIRWSAVMDDLWRINCDLDEDGYIELTEVKMFASYRNLEHAAKVYQRATEVVQAMYEANKE